MAQIIKLSGFKSASNLGKVIVDDFDLKIANIKGLKTWIQPKIIKSDNSFIDRITGYDWQPLYNRNYLTLGAFANGKPAFLAADDALVSYGTNSSVKLNATEFTVAFVAKLSSTGVQPDFIFSPKVIGSGVGLRLGFASPSRYFAMYTGNSDNALRLSYSDSSHVGVTALFMLTFSVEHGLKLYKNGNLVVSNANDKTPLSNLDFNIGQSGDVYSAQAFAGLLGHVLVTDTDLSKSEYAVDKEIIDSLKSFYGI